MGPSAAPSSAGRGARRSPRVGRATQTRRESFPCPVRAVTPPQIGPKVGFASSAAPSPPARVARRAGVTVRRWAVGGLVKCVGVLAGACAGLIGCVPAASQPTQLNSFDYVVAAGVIVHMCSTHRRGSSLCSLTPCVRASVAARARHPAAAGRRLCARFASRPPCGGVRSLCLCLLASNALQLQEAH